jgi:PAS domain S-box-containing protein
MDTATSTACGEFLAAVPPQPAGPLSAGDLEAILDSLVEGIVTLDAGRRITAVNRAACEILEVDKPQALASDCRGLFGERFCAQASQIREAVEKGRPVENVMARLDAPHGPPKMLNFRTGVLRDAAGELRGSLVVFRDVTELRNPRCDAPEPTACEVPRRIDTAHDEPGLVRGALESTGWNIARAARRLSLSRTTLYERIRRYGLERPKE